MKAITVRNLPKAVARGVRLRAKKEGSGINRTVILLLEEAVGLSRRRKVVWAYDDLASLSGTWSRTDQAEFDAALADQRRIDSGSAVIQEEE